MIQICCAPQLFHETNQIRYFSDYLYYLSFGGPSVVKMAQ